MNATRIRIVGSGVGDASRALDDCRALVTAAGERLRRVREAEDLANRRLAELKAARVDAIAREDDRALARLAKEADAITAEDFPSRVQGAELAHRRAVDALHAFLIEHCDDLIREHGSEARDAAVALTDALQAVLDAMDRFAAAEQTSTAIHRAGNRGTGQDVPSLPPVFTDLRRTLRHLEPDAVPVPLPTPAPTATITLEGQPW